MSNNSDTKYFKLAPNQTIFWDPTQPKEENRKLVSDWVLALEETSEVQIAKRNERIIPAEKSEFDASQKARGIKAATEETAKKESTK